MEINSKNPDLYSIRAAATECATSGTLILMLEESGHPWLSEPIPNIDALLHTLSSAREVCMIAIAAKPQQSLPDYEAKVGDVAGLDWRQNVERFPESIQPKIVELLITEACPEYAALVPDSPDAANPFYEVLIGIGHHAEFLITRAESENRSLYVTEWEALLAWIERGIELFHDTVKGSNRDW